MNKAETNMNQQCETLVAIKHPKLGGKTVSRREALAAVRAVQEFERELGNQPLPRQLTEDRIGVLLSVVLAHRARENVTTMVREPARYASSLSQRRTTLESKLAAEQHTEHAFVVRRIYAAWHRFVMRGYSASRQ